MFNALMKVQWKWTRIAALLAVIGGFAIPLASARMLMFLTEVGEQRASDVVQGMQTFGVLYAVLAAGAGLAFALLAWSPDHRGRHVYALSLPVTRARYAAMRFGAGTVFLLAPATAVLVGSLIAIAIAPIPEGLHAYPLSLTIRFLLSSFVAYAIFFMIAASTQRAAAMILGGVGAFFVVAVLLTAMGVEYDLMRTAGTLLFSEPGLLSVFTGRWMLIDV